MPGLTNGRPRVELDHYDLGLDPQRPAAMPRYGQTPTGLVEDALVVASAVMILRGLTDPA